MHAAIHPPASGWNRADGRDTRTSTELHQLAGLPDERDRVARHQPVDQNVWLARGVFEPNPLFEEFARAQKPPRCAHCGGLLKSATISFQAKA